MAHEPKGAVDVLAMLQAAGVTGTVASYAEKQIIFAQGSPADTLYYIIRGRVKLTVVSSRGKEAVISILHRNSFFGEGGLAGQRVRLATATTLTECSAAAFKSKDVRSVIQEKHDFSEFFISYLLSRNARIEEDLADQLVNPSEKRLARALLLLARLGKDDALGSVYPRVDQETLAQMIGTTRSRVSFFMNKFRRQGFIDYDGGLRVHRSLLNFILRD